MKTQKTLKTLLFGASIVALGACSSLEAKAPGTFTGRAEVTPVMTEHSFGLQCLGALIEDSRLQPILVDVGRIRDRTIPNRLNDETRLSQAGEWLVHTAVSKMETPRVRTTIGKGAGPTKLKISGAWTQDDELLRRSGGLAGVGWITGQINLSGRQSYDYIAGDFVSSENGVVLYSTAIGVMLGSRTAEATLLVENGDEFAEVGFNGRWADGPQLAQRRIAEAATLVHVANYYNIDYKPCLESGWGSPASFRQSLSSYDGMNNRDRMMAIQRNLSNLGYAPGAIDGQWGPTSRQALMQFQADQRIPATGKPTAVIYALTAKDNGTSNTGTTTNKVVYPS